MRFILIGLLIPGIASCVNYAGIHEHSIPDSPGSLAAVHRYPLPATPPPRIGPCQWWDKFDDPQLNTLINSALADSPHIQIAQSRLERAQHIAEEAGAALWPSVDMEGYVRREHFSKFGLIPPPFGGTTQNLGQLALNFRYELDFWGKNRQAFAARISQARAEEANLAQAQLMLSTAVASSYFQLQDNLALMQLLQKIVRQRQALLRTVQARAERSITSVIPVSSAKIQVDIFAVIVARAQQDIMVNRHQLAVLIGKNPFTTQISVKSFHYNPKILALPEVLPAHLLARRPDITATLWRVEAAAHQVKVEKARFFPDINLMALLSFQSIGLNKLFNFQSRDYAVQAAFSLPIFDAGYLRADLKARYSEYDLAVGQYNQTILTAFQQVADQLAILHTVKIQLQEQNDAVDIAQRNYRRNYLLYKHGISDYTQVLTAEASWLYQRLFLLQLENLHIQTTIAMIKALGGDYQSPIEIL